MESMTLGTFREFTNNLSNDTVLYISLAEVVRGNMIEREEIEADVKKLSIDEDNNGRPILFISDFDIWGNHVILWWFIRKLLNNGYKKDKNSSSRN